MRTPSGAVLKSFLTSTCERSAGARLLQCACECAEPGAGVVASKETGVGSHKQALLRRPACLQVLWSLTTFPMWP